MQFFTSGLFWFIEGILAALTVIAIRLWTEGRGVVMPWWKWVMTAFWFCLVGFSLAFVGTSLGEREFNAETRTKLKRLEVRMEVKAAKQDAEIHRLRYVELERMQAQLVEAEKLAVLGNLAGCLGVVAGVGGLSLSAMK